MKNYLIDWIKKYLASAKKKPVGLVAGGLMLGWLLNA